MTDLMRLAGLAFMKSYTSIELALIGFMAFVIICLFGMLSNGILGSRGFGIAGNAVLIAFGCGLALFIHDWMVRQPGFGNLGVLPNNLLIGLLAGCALIVLLVASFFRRNYG